MTNEAMNNLRFAILRQAVKDYGDAHASEMKRLISDCERFFKSEWYELLTEGLVDGKTMMKRAREESIV